MRLNYEGDERHVRHERRSSVPRWLAAAMLGLLLLVLLPLAMNHDRRPAAWREDGRALTAPISYDGRVWVPDGAPVLLPDRHMRSAAEAVGGTELFVVAPEVGGGGGFAADRHYVRIEADRYQPVVLRHLKPDRETPKVRR